jgi:uncharacterized protein
VPSWILDRDKIADLTNGCGLLGSGGGGDTYGFRLVLESLVAERGPISVIDVGELAPDALAVNVGFVGAPIAMIEKLFCEHQVVTALKAMRRRLGQPIDAVMAAELGGANGLSAFIAAALLGIPVVDADGMGRAFPLSDQTSYSIYGRSASPTIVTTEYGDIVCVDGGSNRRVEHLVRALSVASGHKCFTVDYALSGDEVRACAVIGTVSIARRIGAALRVARAEHTDPLPLLAAALTNTGGLAVRTLFNGKVVACEHETRAGFGFGRVTLESILPSVEMTIEFQNEFLTARLGGVPVATTPDIISILDSDTLRTIGSDTVRYGQRVKVIAIEAPPLMRSPEALLIVGPRAFGFNLDYQPISART